MRSLALALVGIAWAILGGCGRYRFDPVGTSGDGASQGGSAAFVQSGMTTGYASSGAVTLSPTRAGSLLVIGVANASDTSDSVSGVTDDAGNTYRSASVRAIMNACETSSEIWYASNVRADATTVTVKLTGTIAFGIWAVEFTGASTQLAGSQANDEPATALIAAPVVTSPTDAIVVSIGLACANITGVHSGTQFTGLPVASVADVAYCVTNASGSYGAQWDVAMAAPWCGGTVVFH
ncbi:MAG TPA: hypothetical protein VMJ10_11200 [Kofleriaceae bacterium]|nr:hypothetical protein [Kofleriaceae bacterium]